VLRDREVGLRAEVERVRAEAKKSRGRMVELEAELKDVTEAMDGRVGLAKEEAAGLRVRVEKIGEVEAQLAEVRAAKEELEGRLRSASREAAVRMEQMRVELEEARGRVGALEAKLAEVSAGKDELEGRMGAELDTARGRASALEAMLAEMSAGKEELEGRLRCVEVDGERGRADELEELQRAVNSLQDQLWGKEVRHAGWGGDEVVYCICCFSDGDDGP
jgi:chromosome segregation ATPase